MTKECMAAAEYLMAHSDDWFEDGVREEFNRLEDAMLTAELEVLLEECKFEDKLNRIIFGTGFTDKEIELLNQRYDELLNEWLVENEHHFDSKEDAIEYYIFCERGGQCD